MSYRKAWGDVKSMEERLGIKLVEPRYGRIKKQIYKARGISTREEVKL